MTNQHPIRHGNPVVAREKGEHVGDQEVEERRTTARNERTIGGRDDLRRESAIGAHAR